MSESFRYLINVDQCLNISNYDMFFYKLKDQRRFRFFETAGTSLEQAIDDAGQYLRRYTYETEQTQLIFAVRKRPDWNGTWSETLLAQLLKIRDAVQNGRIDLSGRGGSDRAVVLMTVYDVDFADSWTCDDDYFQGSRRRFANDCRRMLEAASLSDSLKHSAEAVRNAADRLKASGNEEDRLIADILKEFSVTWSQDLAAAEEERLSQLFQEEADEDLFLSKLVQFVWEKLSNYLVIEQTIHNNDLRETTRVFLKLTEYVNSSTEDQAEGEDQFRLDSLAERCRRNWAGIEEDRDLEKRYAEALSRYERKLLYLSRELEDKKEAATGGISLPLKAVPADDSIKTADEHFGAGQKNSRDMSLMKDLEGFRDSCLSDISRIRDWNGKDGIYSRLTNDLKSMEQDLNAYAEKLSKVYTENIGTRIKDTADWDRTLYEIPEDIQKSISTTQSEIDARMKQLKEPGTNASLKFQDQLNMTGALDQSSQSIQLLAERFSGLRTGTFLAVLAVSACVFIAHYFILQSYVLDTYSDLMLALGYVAFVLIISLTAWGLARRTYTRRLKKEMDKLEKGIGEFLNGYFEKAKKFSDYVNLLNQLDYLQRYSGLLEHVRSDAAHMRQLLEWHKVQIKKHLDKVQAFHGLVQTAAPQYDTEDSSELIDVLLRSGEDVVGCRVYWPQSEESR